MKTTAFAFGVAVTMCGMHAFAQGSPGPQGVPVESPPLPPPSAQPEAPPVVAAPTPGDAPAATERSSKRDMLKFALGVRVGYVADRALDPFANTDALAGVSLGVSRTMFRVDKLALALGVAYDGGGRGTNARGLDAGLAWHRLTVPIEGRFHVLPMLYGFARVAPGAHYTTVRIKDPSAFGTLGADGWSFGTDLSVGASVLLGPHAPTARARVWLTPEVGYMATTAVGLALEPSNRDDPRATAPTRLGSLGMNGPFMRVTADLSF